MNPPAFQRLGDESLFSFPGPDPAASEFTPPAVIRILVSRLKESSSGGVRAELTIDSVEGRLLWTSLRLDSDRERVTLANKLAKKFEFDWDDALRMVAQKAVEASRQGEPTIDLASLELPSGPAHLINPLLPHSQTTILYGPGGVGKSLFALWIATATAYSVPLPSLETAEPVNALYLDWETDQKSHRRRLGGLERGWGASFTPGHLFYRHMVSPLADDLPAVRRSVAEHGVGLVIADSLASATGGNLVEAETVVRVMNAFHALGVTVLAIHHVAKGNGRRGGSLYGSAFYGNLARCTWEAKRSEEAGGSRFALFQRKYNDGPLRKEPLGFSVSYGDEGISIGSFAAQSAQFEPDASVADQIDQVLADEALTAPEIADQLGAKSNNVRAVLAQNDDRFRRVGRKNRQTLWARRDLKSQLL